MDKNKIGVLDSGLGGLTVLKELINIAPNNDYYYFGDTERMPFGNKSEKELTKIANEIIEFFLKKRVKTIVIACNTISALILTKLKSKYKNITFVGMIDPVILPIIKTTKNNNVGIMATLGTINSKAHEKSLKNINNSINVTNVACEKLVPLIEKKDLNSKDIHEAVQEYINYIPNEVDTIVLGCTHYPLIKNIIQQYLSNVILIDPAIEVAKKVDKVIDAAKEQNMDIEFDRNFYITGNVEEFQKKAEVFLNKEINNIEKIYLHEILNGGYI